MLDQDLLVRQAFTGGVLQPVGDDDLKTYLAPYPTRESRRPLLAWARQMPLGGEPAELVARIDATTSADRRRRPETGPRDRRAVRRLAG
ncbi:hypothetical protein [Micromonospora chersina]|uniref:hypothetical protein n=1 Tax=Micromonospora chersina TaxID=47854 RepID=UPI0037142C2E